MEFVIGYHLRLSKNASQDGTSPIGDKVNTIADCTKELCLCLPNKCKCNNKARKVKISANINGSGWNNVPVAQRCLVHSPTKVDVHDSNCIGCEPVSLSK